MSASEAGTFVQIDPVKLAEFMRSSDGPVFRMLIEDGERVKDEAKRRAPVYQEPPGGPTRKRRPGQLRDSIVKRVGVENDLPVVQVGSEDPVALLVHEGTQPHTIPANPVLAFWSNRYGRVIVVRTPNFVQHPGTDPNRFLLESLEVLRHVR